MLLINVLLFHGFSTRGRLSCPVTGDCIIHFFVARKNFSFPLERSSLVLLKRVPIGSYSHFEKLIVMHIVGVAITVIISFAGLKLSS